MPLPTAAAAVSVGLLASAARIVLDLVAGPFPGLGIDFFPLGRSAG